jgi:ribonuclease D
VDHFQKIESDSALAALVTDHQGADAVIVDTEFMRRDTFYPQAALIQLCFSDQDEVAWLIDPLLIEDFGPLCELFENSAIVKIVHSPSEDLEVFQCLLGVQPQPLFDTQRAAAFLGLGFGVGYRALVEAQTGRVISKDETRSDWLARPLSEGQLAYAAADVVPLLPIYHKLAQQLSELGRLDWLLEEGESAISAAAGEPEPTYLKVKSAWKLNARQLGVLQLICAWREERARRLDKPRNWILQDKLCLQLAEQCPRNERELELLKDLPPSVMRKQGDSLVSLVEEGMGLASDQLPERLPKPLTGPQRDMLKALKKAARQLAGEWGLDAEVLLPARDYEILVRLGSGEAVTVPERWYGWRRQPLLAPLLRQAGAGELP